MIDKKSNIADLLPLYYEGKLSEQDQNVVHQWIASSEENREIASCVETLYRDTDTVYALERVDTDKALQHLHGRMRRDKWHKVWLWSQRTAAILFLPAFILSLFHFWPSKKAVVNYVTLNTCSGMVATTRLPDGTKVTLNSNTSLVYPVVFDGGERKVELKGEAFFEVVKDAAHPFIVGTPQQASVKVYGTRFNVDAYPEEETATATLVSGSISMLCPTANHACNEYKISPNQKIQYSRRTREVEVLNTSTLTETSWKNGQMIFDRTPLVDVLRCLTKRFGVKFVVKDARCYESSLTGTIKNQQLDRILEYCRISSGLHFKVIPNKNNDDEKRTIEIY